MSTFSNVNNYSQMRIATDNIQPQEMDVTDMIAKDTHS